MTKTKQSKWQLYTAIGILIIVGVGITKYMWFEQVYLKPQNVFWDTINQNLQTGSVTKNTIQKFSDLQLVDQQTTLQFKGELFAYTTVTIEDKTSGNQSKVITDTFGTPTQDYLSYKKIQRQGMATPNNVINVWAVNTKSDKQQIQILSDALISSPIFFGYLNGQKRAELINQMKNDKVFDIDFNNVDKNDKTNGKNNYAFKLKINLDKYIKVYKNYLTMIGQKDIAAQLGQPQNGATYRATLYINPISRQPVKLLPEGAKDGETYSNINVNLKKQPPKNVKLPILELQKRLAS